MTLLRNVIDLWGYPLALVLMLAVAIGPILYLKRKGWF